MIADDVGSALDDLYVKAPDLVVELDLTPLMAWDLFLAEASYDLFDSFLFHIVKWHMQFYPCPMISLIASVLLSPEYTDGIPCNLID